MWAEKEMRNYRRLATAGVPCPEALLLKEHVLALAPPTLVRVGVRVRVRVSTCCPSASNPPLAAPCLAGCFQPLTLRPLAAPYSRLNVPAAAAPLILT